MNGIRYAPTKHSTASVAAPIPPFSRSCCWLRMSSLTIDRVEPGLGEGELDEATLGRLEVEDL